MNLHHSFRCAGSVPILVFIGYAFLRGPEPPGQASRFEEGPAARLDLYGDPLPAGTIMRLGTTRFRHAGPVRCLAVSPDGRLLAPGGDDNVVRLWDAATRREIRQFSIGNELSPPTAVAFSPDGKALVCSVKCVTHLDHPLSLWDVSSGRQIRFLNGIAQETHGVMFTPDGKFVICGGPNLIDVASGALVRSSPRKAAHSSPLGHQKYRQTVEAQRASSVGS